MPLYGNLVRDKISPAIKVVVTAELIAKAVAAGGRCNAFHCMIDDAVEEGYNLRDKKGVLKRAASYGRTDLQTIRVSDLDLGLRYWYLTPMIAQKALLAFDRGEEVKPFSFILREAQVHRCGWKGQSQRTAANRKGVRYKKTGQPRKSPQPAQTRSFGLCLFQHTGRHEAAEVTA